MTVAFGDYCHSLGAVIKGSLVKTLHPIATTVAMAITLCLLWFLVIVILYHLTRTALLSNGPDVPQGQYLV